MNEIIRNFKLDFYSFGLFFEDQTLIAGGKDASLPFMTRLPKKRGITQDGEDKTLSAHQEFHHQAPS